jgi:hypothetical protein
MSNDTELELLQDRVRRLEQALYKLEKSPLSGLPRWRRFGASMLLPLIIFCSFYGLMAYWGPKFGHGPSRVEASTVEAYKVRTEGVYFENPDDSEENWGLIQGKYASIRLEGEDGLVKIDPTGIRIEGPDGVLVLKPEKK